MKISTKGIYGLMVMIDISIQENEIVSLRNISKRLGLSYKYLEQVIKLLKNSGLLKSTKGKDGGYSLNKDINEITALEILNSQIGDIAFVDCVKKEEYCKKANRCKTHQLWVNIYMTLSKRADEVSLYDLKKCIKDSLRKAGI